MKKATKHAFLSKQPMPSKLKEEKEALIKEKLETRKQKKREKKKRIKNNKKEKQKEVNVEADNRKQDLLLINKQEDKVIRQLEKSLKMKRKKLPASFINDGLDYLLDLCDPDKSKKVVVGDSDSESDLVNWLESKKNKGKLGDAYSDEADSGSEASGEKSNAHQELVSNKQSRRVKLNKQDVQTDHNTEKETKKRLCEGEASQLLPRKKLKATGKISGDLEDKEDSDGSESMDSKDSMDGDESIDREESGNEDESVDGEEDWDGDELLGKKGTSDKDYDSDGEGSQNESSLAEDSEEDRSPRNTNNKEDFGENDDCDSDDGETANFNQNKSKQTRTQASGSNSYTEDIYGRLRDKKGNVVTGEQGSYVPPGKRALLSTTDDGKHKAAIEKLNKQLKGSLNRLSESNIAATSAQVAQLYLSHSKNDMNTTLVATVQSACMGPVQTPERLAMEHSMLVSVLHHNVGSEVGAYFLQMLAKRFDELYSQGENYGQGKECDNVLTLFANLYNFKVVHCQLMFDLLRKLMDSFTGKDIELILLLLKQIGFGLRKDDPSALKDVIVELQNKATNAEQFRDQSRVKFMLEVILAIKNNNMRKIPNYDRTHLEHLRKLLRHLVRGSTESELRISLHDLLNAEERGRWWVVGSALRDQQDAQPVSEEAPVSVVSEATGRVLELARQQRMNTDVRRNVFCVIMMSEDYLDAFEKLLRLGLKNQQEKEMVNIAMHCAVQEKSYNPFYAHLLRKLCAHDRKFMMMTQFYLWDKFKEIGNLSELQAGNLAKTLVFLIATKSLSLAVFKVVEFGELEKPMVHFLRGVLLELLLEQEEETTRTAFLRLASAATAAKLRPLREGLRLFLHHFLLRNKHRLPVDTQVALASRVAVAEAALGAADSKVLL
ncbi:PREDICTED: nucleolar MIF4G domain-containing protein 1-like [Priapulus caudatus]|uniref:Nucleolar MIF4G domain-containing protein 1-like n=1 Tax=Priapulus caudatus TaxID=37621 RepID=A0ABM1EAU3_PRICU|nr:PREDICTED: nucleolar MIF4G domain-containing protein 1-like [Priapulus caudatus]